MKKKGTLYLVQMALLVAIIILMAFTPIGYIRMPGLEITLIVVPVAAEENTSRAQFTVHGMYYVTKDRYVLSAYQEEAAPEKQFSGAKVEVLLQELKKP